MLNQKTLAHLVQLVELMVGVYSDRCSRHRIFTVAFVIPAVTCSDESESTGSSSSTGIIFGVVIGLLCVAVGISGLIGGIFIARKHR